MSHAHDPARPVPSPQGDARRRAWTIATVVAVVAVIVIVLSVAHHETRPAGSTGAGSPAATTPPGRSAASSGPVASVTPATPTSPAAPGGLDVDGDGTQDTARTSFAGKQTARLTAHLGDGKTLTSMAFPLYPGDGAGTVFWFDVDGDGRAELLVSAPGGDGMGYLLFQDVNDSLVRVPAPKGQDSPYLYVGGGIYYASTFGCTDHHLVEVHEAPVVRGSGALPANPRFVVTTRAYELDAGVLRAVATHTTHAADRAAAQRLLASQGNRCGTGP